MPVLRFFLKAAHIAIRIARVSCTWSSLRPGTEEALGTARMNDRGRDVGPAARAGSTVFFQRALVMGLGSRGFTA